MTKLPLLDFHHHGCVTQDKLEEILGTLKECYSRLGQWLPERVEVQLFDAPVQLIAFLQSEKVELGVKTFGDEAFICSHDAWRGSPRLLVCSEKLFCTLSHGKTGCPQARGGKVALTATNYSNEIPLVYCCLSFLKSKIPFHAGFLKY